MQPARRWAYLKWFDFYTKAQEEVKNRSGFGAAVTLLATVLLLVLVWNEWLGYLQPNTTDSIGVDNRPEERLTITVDIDFFGLPCSKANIDLVDDSGESSIPFTTSSRLHKDPLNVARQSLWYCGSCEPQRAATTRSVWSRIAKTCCNTCEDVRKHYQMRHLDPTLADISEQCMREKHNAQFGSVGGCRVYGQLEAPKVKGNLHIAAGNSSVQAHQGHTHHVHSITHQDLKSFDISHVINELSFGPDYRGLQSPLAGARYQATGPVQLLYIVQLVPTSYVTLNGWTVHSQQYAATEHVRQIAQSGQLLLPGLFLKYDIAPYRITYVEEGRAFIPFLVRLCAVTGGVYATLGLLYGVIDGLVKRKKQ